MMILLIVSLSKEVPQRLRQWGQQMGHFSWLFAQTRKTVRPE